MRKRKTHSTLITVLVFANVFVVTLLFNHYLDSRITESRDPLALMGSAVGISAGVPANEWNSFAQELRDWEKELEMREQAIVEQETLIAESTNGASKQSTVYITAIGLLLLVLVVLNFVLDWRRTESLNRRREE